MLPVTKETSADQALLKDYPVSADILPHVSIDFACFHRFLLSLQRWARDATVGAEGCPIGVQVCITENSNHLETFLLKMVFMQVVGRHFQE